MGLARGVRTSNPEELYERAVAALARRGRTVAEMNRWLAARGASASAAAEVTARLRDHGYLDDRRLAESYATHQRDFEKHGRARVERDLRRRGVASALAAGTARDAYASSDEAALIAAHLHRKRITAPRDARQAAALYRRLWAAGFSAQGIQAALRRLRAPEEWMDDLAAPEAESLD